MSSNFIDRLRNYYLKVAKVLRGEADAAGIFPNPTDKGSSRERIYIDFLKQHAPSKCNVFAGGFLFDDDGAESKQLDVIVTTDTAPQFNFHNPDGGGKSFSPVNGALAVVSIKSNLDKKELFDSLDGIASIPRTTILGDTVNPLIRIRDHASWPLKIKYAYSGIKSETLYDHLISYYNDRPEIPPERRPEIIHVAGQYLLLRETGTRRHYNKATGITRQHNPYDYFAILDNADLEGITEVLHSLQQMAAASTQLNYSYHGLFDKVAGDSNIAYRDSAELRTNIGGSIDVIAPPAFDSIDKKSK